MHRLGPLNGRSALFLVLAFAVEWLAVAGTAQSQTSESAARQAAVRAAVAAIAPCVVRIETIGGLERVGGVNAVLGPTTGLIVSPQGHILSSAFNFVEEPSSILVVLPDGTQLPARQVATDESRMLVLLKVEPAAPLPTPVVVPQAEFRVGQTVLALGRAYDGELPNVSTGIVSAVERIWGKAIQTDAKVSPNNYGGPLVDLQGRVLGVLVPLAPEGNAPVAGVEWYDSGIGFAVPLEQVQQRLSQLQEGRNLKPGLLGVSFDSADLFSRPAVVAACIPKSPAYEAGLQPGDRIVAANGRPVERIAQLKHVVGPLYSGDLLQLTIVRGDQQFDREVTLVDHIDPFVRPFLGVLPERNASEGLRIRFVYPNSPAASAGLAAGDVLLAIDGQPVANRADAAARIVSAAVGQKWSVLVRRGNAEQTVEVTLGREPTETPQDAPAPRPVSGDAPADLPPIGWTPIRVPEFKNECFALVPADYDGITPHGVVVWLHPPGGYKDDELTQLWQAACSDYDLILLAPRSADASRWEPGEAEFVAKALQRVRADYLTDSARVVAAGAQVGGGLASYLAFTQRGEIRGLALVDAPFFGRPAENDPALPLAVWAAKASSSPFAPVLQPALDQLKALEYSLVVHDLGEISRPLSDTEFSDLVQWIDSLDRL